MSARKKFHNMVAMEEKDSCTHSKLKQKEPFPKKKKQKRQKEKTLKITGGALYITFIFMNRSRSNRLCFVLLNLYPKQ